MYMRVALMMPLFFRVSTDELIAKRKRYKKILLAIDLLIWATLCCTTTYAILNTEENWYVPLFWCGLSVFMTGTFIFSFLKIRHHTKGLAKEDKMGTRRLLYAHCVAFLTGMICTTVSSVLITIQRHQD